MSTCKLTALITDNLYTEDYANVKLVWDEAFPWAIELEVMAPNSNEVEYKFMMDSSLLTFMIESERYFGQWGNVIPPSTRDDVYSRFMIRGIDEQGVQRIFSLDILNTDLAVVSSAIARNVANLMDKADPRECIWTYEYIDALVDTILYNAEQGA